MNCCTHRILSVLIGLMACALSFAQTAASTSQHIEKRYNIFFRINSATIDEGFKDNKRALDQMRKDIETTIQLDGAIPDSLTICSTASPDGRYEFNKWLATNRAKSTVKLLLEMIPELKDTHITVEHLDEDWDGLMQVLLAHPEFPQREEMLNVINSGSIADRETRLRALTQGWNHLVENYIHALRNSSITISVAMTADNYKDEFVRGPIPLTFIQKERINHPQISIQPQGDIAIEPVPVKHHKTHFAARTNLIMPGLSIGLEFPIHEHWSIGINYNYPWAVSKRNKWCVEKLSWFVDTKYWFTNSKTNWTPNSRLKGHGVGLYAGFGYYDFQNSIKGAQGEFIDFGVDYVYGLPVANDKLRMEFNIGLGFIKTWYRPYTPSTDYTDLIKEPGVKYRSTNFMGPTRLGVSLVYPITTTVKKNPHIKVDQRIQRKAQRKVQRQTKKQEVKND